MLKFLKALFQQSDFGDVLKKRIKPTDVIGIRLNNGDKRIVRVARVDSDFLEGYFRVATSTNVFRQELETINPDTIVSFWLVEHARS